MKILNVICDVIGLICLFGSGASRIAFVNARERIMLNIRSGQTQRI
jgi:hypothetical protein